MKRMRFAAALHGIGASDPAALAGYQLATARAARDAGYAAVVAGQHFLAGSYLQPLPLLARLVPETGSMRLVAGVLLMPLLHPVVLAEELATLDVLSGGRLVIGAGQGYRDHEFDAFGVPRAERLRRQLSALDRLAELWAADPPAGPLRPVQRPRPPIWYAAASRRTFDRAVARGYVPFIGGQVSRAAVADLVAGSAAPAESVVLRRDVLVTDLLGAAEVARSVRAHRAAYPRWYPPDAGSAGEARVERAPSSAPGGRKSPPGEPLVVGPLAECRDRLLALAADGVDTVVIRCHWPELDPAVGVDMLVALAEGLGLGEPTEAG